MTNIRLNYSYLVSLSPLVPPNEIVGKYERLLIVVFIGHLLLICALGLVQLQITIYILLLVLHVLGLVINATSDNYKNTS